MCDGWSLSTNTSYHPGGRIWVLWNPTIFHVQFMYYTAQLIHMEIIEISTQFYFYCTMVYAFNDTGERKDLWTTLNGISSTIRGPWMLCGDFNCVLCPAERLGGHTTEKEISDFQDYLDHCQLFDSPAAGIFDHSPCVVQDVNSHVKGRRSFKYYNMWSQVPDFIPCIQTHWNTYWPGTKMFRVVMKLKALKKPLKALNQQLFADIENSAAHAWKILDAIQDQLKLDPTDASLISKEKEVAGVYINLQSACYSFYLQKTKATWVNQGDNNTRYFHSLLKGRSAKNKVFLIEDHHGVT
ncbi:uncharacterized protein LOC141632772 [Silene latifolia]|uniref:uncharacterized protein LOC141632772 n=1 Tax=Silene latifolia TaxID=37657 RepID=UPI003D779A40